jgi:hypothetical protein
MTREERCQEAVKKGYTYDSETGFVKNKHGKVLKNIGKSGYNRLAIYIEKKAYKLHIHQFGWYFIHGYCAKEIDHINGVRFDNRLCNLRPVTRQQNQWNRNTAKGYYFHKANKKYKAQIRLNYKNFHVGYYNTEEQAREAYLQAKQKYHNI